MDKFIESQTLKIIDAENSAYVCKLLGQIHLQFMAAQMARLKIKNYIDKQGTLWYLNSKNVLCRISKESQGRLKTSKRKESKYGKAKGQAAQNHQRAGKAHQG